MKLSKKLEAGKILMGLGIVGLMIALVLPVVGVNLFAQAAPPKAPPATCATKVQFLAYSAPARSHNFGAAVNPATKDEAVSQLKSDLCTDPLLFATINAFANSGLNLDASAAETKAQYYASHSAAWNSDVTAFFATAKNFQLVDDPNKYYSIGMVPGTDNKVMPSLVRGEEPVDIGKALTFDYNGQTRELREKCREQPVEHHPFPHVPPPTNVCTPSKSNNYCGHPTCAQLGNCPTPTHTPTPTPTPSHSTTTPPPPKTCESVYGKGYEGTYPNCTKPPQSWDCQQNAGPNCPTNPAHQPPQSPGNGVQSTATNTPPGVSTEPSPQPTKPVDTKSPPPANSSGNNGGSTSNPVVSGTPTPGNSATHTGAPPTCAFGC